MNQSFTHCQYQEWWKAHASIQPCWQTLVLDQEQRCLFVMQTSTTTQSCSTALGKELSWTTYITMWRKRDYAAAGHAHGQCKFTPSCSKQRMRVLLKLWMKCFINQGDLLQTYPRRTHGANAVLLNLPSTLLHTFTFPTFSWFLSLRLFLLYYEPLHLRGRFPYAWQKREQCLEEFYTFECMISCRVLRMSGFGNPTSRAKYLLKCTQWSRSIK